MKVVVAAIHNDGLPENSARSKLKVLEPKTFGGECSAKKLENFLWDIEQYFKAAKVSIAKCIDLASMYLAGYTKLQWHTRTTDSALPKIDTWEALEKAMTEQFLPTNTSWGGREALRMLKHTSTVQDYVKDFSSLLGYL